MTYIARNDTSIVGKWWNEIDQTLLWCILAAIIFGWLIMFTGSVQTALAEAETLMTFSVRKLIFAGLAVVTVIIVSMLRPDEVERLTLSGFGLAVILLLAIFVLGVETKGATRWIALPGLPFYPQPTEFAKPMLVLLMAWSLSKIPTWGMAKALGATVGAFALIAGLVILQPDISQTAFLGLLFLGMLFLAGLGVQWVVLLMAAGAGGLSLAYMSLAHVRYRIDSFVSRLRGTDGDMRDHNDMAADAFRNGGIEGLGLGEGRLKTSIPEAQNDMPLAIIGEELGLLGTLLVLILFLLIWLRVQSRLAGLGAGFPSLAAAGLALLLIGQALINIFYTVGLIPTTGITLPFFSDGGSSLLASALTVGLLLALTRQKGKALHG